MQLLIRASTSALLESQLFFLVVRLTAPFKLLISFHFTSSRFRNHSLLLY